MRLAAGPVAGHLADRYDATRAVLGIAAAAAGLISFAYLAGYGFWPLLAVSVLHASAIAALAPLADALALAAAEREGTFSYGWVRGAGSAAFVLGTLASGLLVARAGLASIIVSSGLLFLVMAVATSRVPAAPAAGRAAEPRPRRHPRTPGPRAVPADAPRGGARHRQPRAERRLRGDPLARGRHRAGHDQPALVGERSRPRSSSSCSSDPGCWRAWAPPGPRCWPPGSACCAGRPWPRRPRSRCSPSSSRCTGSPSRCCTSPTCT